MTTADKLNALRKAIKEHDLFAYLIPNTDPHQSEYIADHWRTLAWLSGFTGSAANMVVTEEFAGLWTDSRYFIQAEEQLRNSSINLMKLNVPHTPEFIDWIVEHTPEGANIGLDGSLYSLSSVESMKKSFRGKGLNITDVGDLVGTLWEERPSIPTNRIFEHEVKFAGKSRKEKLSEVREEMQEAEVNAHLITTLDDIAWLFNIRGNDVQYNPVAISYALILEDETRLYIDAGKIPGDFRKTLKKEGIVIRPYEAISEDLQALPGNTRLLFSPTKTNLNLHQSIPEGVTTKEDIHLTTPLKSVKNETEVEHIRRVMVRDGMAMVRFLIWLEEHVGKITITEFAAGEKLREFRALQEGFFGESFGTIAGYQGHGAIVHYSATPDSSYELQPEGIFLLDSGGQYLEGTTDITRTIALGEPSAEQKRDNTLVLKGHIALARAVYPDKTRGYQLEVLARQFLWSHHLNYGHGTGHGVGFFLNVHEGPQSIGSGATASKAAILKPGMLTSNEPGIYHTGKYGIRIENLVLTVPHAGNGDFGNFLAFETVTLCPIDLKLVDAAMLSHEEKTWLNDYHEKVFEALSPHLSASEVSWLRNQTRAI